VGEKKRSIKRTSNGTIENNGAERKNKNKTYKIK